jgi:hypothetical protein
MQRRKFQWNTFKGVGEREHLSSRPRGFFSLLLLFFVALIAKMARVSRE